MIARTSPKRRAVVTGIGVVSPVGNSKEEFWRALTEGRSGVCEVFPARGRPSTCAAAARDFCGGIEDFGPLDQDLKKAIRKALKLMNRETKMAVAAAQQAIGDSRLRPAAVDPERIGVCFGAGVASMLPEDFLAAIQSCTDEKNSFDFKRWGSEGLQHVAPLWLLKCLPNMPACQIAVLNDIRGPNNSITQREASGNLAIAEACSLIADDEVDVVVAGATGTTILPINMIHTLLETEVAPGDPNPAKVCRPFDRQRKGTVLGEGAAVIVLEEASGALRRGAKVYGEVRGFGSVCVTRRGGDQHRVVALASAMRTALARSGWSASDVGHIHAYGLSTHLSDIDEAQAIRDVFGNDADRLPIVAAKSSLGNAGAGSGAIEIVASLLALQHGRLFPVLNYETPDRDCPVAPVTTSDVPSGNSFFNLSLASHGRASCLLMSTFQ